MEPVNESTSGSLKWLVLPTLAAEIVLSGIMLGCYALFAALRQDILLGAALGTAAALVNFAAMILGLLRASKKENPLSAQLTRCDHHADDAHLAPRSGRGDDPLLAARP